MKPSHQVLGVALVVLCFASFDAGAQAAADAGEVLELGGTPPDARAVAEGLFPEDACDQLKAAGFKCMGVKPALRYALPTTSFRAGSAELPDALKAQLQVFAQVLKSRRGAGRMVRIEGHTDAAGSPAANVALSLRRAQAVKDYLVDQGADAAQLTAVGLGASELRDPRNPLSPENRRIEIVRASSGAR
jgi:outer membrane protein OmpA-like peptidoglycan-associated protein